MARGSSRIHQRPRLDYEYRPYLDKDGANMLRGGGSLVLASQSRFIGPGHAGIFESGGTNWFSYHYYDEENRGRAVLAVRQLHWTADGWPELR